MHAFTFAHAVLAALLALGAGRSPAATPWPAEPDLAAGRQIYLDGLGPDGRPLRAQLQRDVATGDRPLGCAGCHGRSGMGVGEGQRIAPAVSGARLYRPREIRRPGLYDARTVRPAYTDESLARAIRDGIDANGRALDPLMPRYALDDAELRNLVGYLKSLSSTLSPGVDDTNIHFATIVADDAAPRDRTAMLAVLEAFFAGKAAATRYEASRAERGPFHMERHYQAYRRWNLHVWELRGPAATWREQLEGHYERRPVFAILGGIGGDAWQPIHAFCEQRAVPCLLPNTELPVIAEKDYYTVYFSKGVALEAQVLAAHLCAAATPVAQVYRRQPSAMRAAAELRQAMHLRGINDVQDWPVDDGARVATTLQAHLPKHGPGPRLVLWLDAADLADAAAATAATAGPVYVSSALLEGALAAVPGALGDEVYAVHLRDVPDDAARRLRPLDVWMKSRGIPLTNAALQANTLFTATLAAQALKHIGSLFHRDYFIERIEHIFDSMVTPSAYPRPSLGPGQRFASKGGYVLRISKGEVGTLASEREWVVP
jgi:mono/diheme cytochrome c family protein